jgi:hypothetical protein
MTLTIDKFLQLPRYRKQLDAVIDLTHAFLMDPDKEKRLQDQGMRSDPRLLSQYQVPDEYAPIKLTDDFKFEEWLTKANMSIASVTATGQEIPQTRMGELLRIEGGMIKITISHVYDEETEIRMYELGQMANIPQGFVDLIFGSVDRLQPRVIKTMNALWGQVITRGQVTWTDPRTNVSVSLRYDTRPELFPAPLTGNDAWNQYATANGIRNLIELNNAHYSINGFYADEALMSKRTRDALLQQSSTADYARSLGLITASGTGMYGSTYVDSSLLDKASEKLDIPKPRIWDAEYELEVAPNQFVRARYLPDNYVALVTKGMSQRVWGPTIEAVKSGAGAKAGIFVKPDEVLKTSPPQYRSYAVGRGIPFVSDARRLCAMKVMD